LETYETWEFEVPDPAYGRVTEGPVWDGSGLLFTRIQQSRIMRYDPAANSITIVRENTNYANGMTLDSEGRLYACLGGAEVDARRVVRYNADGTEQILADQFEGKRLNIPNDVVVDPEGRVWFTDPCYEGAAGPWSHDRANKEQEHNKNSGTDETYPNQDALQNGSSYWVTFRLDAVKKSTYKCGVSSALKKVAPECSISDRWGVGIHLGSNLKP
jgi:streptogramin lyase